MTAHPHSISDVEFEQMREARNHARDIAVTLEQELAAANADVEKAECAIAGALGCLDAANDFEDPLPGSVQRARTLLRSHLLGGES